MVAETSALTKNAGGASVSEQKGRRQKSEGSQSGSRGVGSQEKEENRNMEIRKDSSDV